MAGDGRQPNAVVFLSLYLLLLAFFILMNSISHRQADRADLAMGSVAATFNAKLDAETRPYTSGTEAGFRTASDHMLNDVRKLFEKAMPVARILPEQADGTMQIEMPTTAVFRPGDVNPRPRVMSLLDGIAEGLSQELPGWRFEIELMLGSGPVLPQGDELNEVLELRRAGGIARALRDFGVADEAIRTGLSPNDPGVMRIAFFARQTGKARVTLDKAAMR